MGERLETLIQCLCVLHLIGSLIIGIMFAVKHFTDGTDNDDPGARYDKGHV